MKLAFRGVLVLACAFLAYGCSSDDKPANTPSSQAGAGGDAAQSMNGDGGSAVTPSGDACQVGCQGTLAAKCSNGPKDQASCESTCNALSAGKCGGEYTTFQACAEGKAITCSAQGQPIVAACSDQQAAFVACING